MSENNNNLSVWMVYIKSCLTFHYLTNISFIVCMLAYYMNATEIFFIFAPLIIANFILINIAQICNFSELNIGLLGKEILNHDYRDIIIPSFALYNFLKHLLPALWLYYILQKTNIIKKFNPKFMNIFCKSIILPLIYYYYQIDLKIYGDINYLVYLIVYLILLLATSYLLYK